MKKIKIIVWVLVAICGFQVHAKHVDYNKLTGYPDCTSETGLTIRSLDVGDSHNYIGVYTTKQKIWYYLDSDADTSQGRAQLTLLELAYKLGDKISYKCNGSGWISDVWLYDKAPAFSAKRL